MNTCRFCQIVSGELQHHVFFENEQLMAFLDRQPLNPGHTLLIPKRHIDYFFDMPDDLYREIFDRAKMLEPILKKSMAARRVGFAVSGFTIHHAHLHLVPMHGDRELDPRRAKQATAEELERAYRRIMKVIHA